MGPAHGRGTIRKQAWSLPLLSSQPTAAKGLFWADPVEAKAEVPPCAASVASLICTQILPPWKYKDRSHDPALLSADQHGTLFCVLQCRHHIEYKLLIHCH